MISLVDRAVTPIIQLTVKWPIVSNWVHQMSVDQLFFDEKTRNGLRFQNLFIDFDDVDGTDLKSVFANQYLQSKERPPQSIMKS
jgi:hypothetical protein